MPMGDTFGSGAKPIYYASDSYDPPSIANWATTTHDITCTGAEEGMFVSVGHTKIGAMTNHKNLHLNGYVLAGGDEIRVVLSNMGSTSNIDVAAGGTLYVKATFG